METDDDIFIIHKRAESHINDLCKQKAQKHQQQLQLLKKLLSSKPPHGFSLQDWHDIADQYHLNFDELQSSLTTTTAPVYKAVRRKRMGGSPIRTSPKKSPIKSPRMLRLSYKECKDLMQQIQDLDYYDSVEIVKGMYDSHAGTILDQYKQCINNVIYTDFMAPTKQKDISPEQKHLRDQLIHLIEQTLGAELLEKIVTRKFNVGKIDDTDEAAEQHTTTTEEFDDGDEDWNSMVYNDINRINFNIKFKYDKRLHFKETINQYQGLQHKNIPQDVFDDLIAMIENHGLADMTKQDPKERYAKLRKEHITMFLSESNHSIYYEDKQLIYSKITSHPCPNIQKYEKGLYSDFEQLVETFLQLPEDKVDRKNFLNTHYVLRQLLRKRGVTVPTHDLNIIKTPARIRAHDDIYQICCEKLGWHFEPLG